MATRYNTLSPPQKDHDLNLPELSGTKTKKSPKGIIRHTEGAGEGAYREIIHKSLQKIHVINEVVDHEKCVDLDNLASKQREEVEALLQEQSEQGDGCYCSKCTCGKHFCPKRTVRCKYPVALTSSYRKEFVPHPFDKTGDNFNVNTVRKLPSDNPIDGRSTYKVYL
eukprot:TRINITY_DN1361_c0_g1_i3.p2 TRINITY_DN1361_c0_g1~~TRINITY_DN1361_c0_g1_i3.p2  ORF type:complete len:176 (-),score=12.39 TRINITY_DN1361_c0_g1_i3:642-1142(-)